MKKENGRSLELKILRNGSLEESRKEYEGRSPPAQEFFSSKNNWQHF